MKVLLIQNPVSSILSSTAISYLRTHSKFELKIDDQTNLSTKIVDGYLDGFRHFILAVTSGEILSISNLIASLADAQFVATSSTLSSLRGQFPNLYFAAASNLYVNLIIADFSSTVSITALVYDYSEDPFVAEVIRKFSSAGFATFDVKSSGWQSYTNLILVSIDDNIWTQVTSNTDPTFQYSLYCLEIFPPADYTPPTNIIGVNVLYPTGSVSPQINSYWNDVSRFPEFCTSTQSNAVYPILLNFPWSQLETLNLISSNYQENGYSYSRSTVIYDIVIRSNQINCHVPPKANYIWLLAPEYINVYSQANLDLILELIPTIRKVKVTTNFKESVRKYWCRGYRSFILDGPSSEVKAVQTLKLRKGFFYCPRAIDPEIRVPGSSFLFGLADDNTMIEQKFNTGNRATLSGLVCVLGSSNNINIPEFQAQLDRRQIPYVSIDALDTIPFSTYFIDVIGNDADYERVFEYVVKNRAQFVNLGSVGKYSLYITESQYSTLVDIGLSGLFSIINFNSSQPFLESTYSQLSRPLYLPNYIVFLYLSNILLGMSPRFLFDFGYIIDV